MSILVNPVIVYLISNYVKQLSTTTVRNYSVSLKPFTLNLSCITSLSLQHCNHGCVY